MTNIERVVGALETLHDMASYRKIGSDDCQRIRSATFDAINLIKSYEPHVLSKEELRNGARKGVMAVYIEWSSGKIDGPVLVDPEETDDIDCTFVISYYKRLYWNWHGYGVAFRCWTALPSEQQRKTVKWG